MTYHLATYTSGDDFTCGDLAIPGFSVQQKVTDAVPTVDGTQDAQSIGINYAGELLTNVNLSAAQLHAMLKYLPSEIYHAIGSLFEEIAAAFYKGVGDISLISQYRQQAIIRLQDKITKTRIDQAKDIAIYTTEGVVTGEDDYLGYVQARDTSHVFLQALAPNIYNWVFDQVPLGIRAYTIDE